MIGLSCRERCATQMTCAHASSNAIFQSKLTRSNTPVCFFPSIKKVLVEVSDPFQRLRSKCNCSPVDRRDVYALRVCDRFLPMMDNVRGRRHDVDAATFHFTFWIHRHRADE